MKFQFTIRDLLLIIVIAALAAGWWIDHQRINRMTVQKWEYKMDPWLIEGLLTDSGDQGWEMCGIVPEDASHNVKVIYKRPKQ